AVGRHAEGLEQRISDAEGRAPAFDFATQPLEPVDRRGRAEHIDRVGAGRAERAEMLADLLALLLELQADDRTACRAESEPRLPARHVKRQTARERRLPGLRLREDPAEATSR